jgi:hypothetical protein
MQFPDQQRMKYIEGFVQRAVAGAIEHHTWEMFASEEDYADSTFMDESVKDYRNRHEAQLMKMILGGGHTESEWHHLATASDEELEEWAEYAANHEVEELIKRLR